VVKVGLLQTFPEIGYLVRRYPGAFPLLVAGMIACWGWSGTLSWSEGLGAAHTELDRVQRGNVTAKRLHCEDGNLIADIASFE
jgi:hypothetical protein